MEWSEYLKKQLAAVLIFSVAMGPVGVRLVHGEESKPEKEVGRILIQEALHEINQRYAKMMSSMPKQLAQDVKTAQKIEMDQKIEAEIKSLQEQKLNINQIRVKVLRANLKEIENQKRELYSQIQNMSIEGLDRLGKVLEQNENYAQSLQEFQSAFTRTEKANAIFNAISRDLDVISSVALKNSNLLTESGWVNQLRNTQLFFGTKSSDDDDVDWGEIIGFAALSIAVTGLVTWGVASAVYGGRYDDRESQLKDQFNQLKGQLESHYNSYNQQLTNDEKQYLKDSGFKWMTCMTFEQPDSIICNKYNYQVFSGSKYCHVECYKNISTGQETMHTAATCTSSFIPTDCYDPSEFQRGYDLGYHQGYDSGYHDGDHDGYHDGANDGDRDGYHDGKQDGYDDGYHDGFRRGYDSYSGMTLTSMKTVSAAKLVFASLGLDLRSPGYKNGFEDGQRDGQLLLQAQAVEE